MSEPTHCPNCGGELATAAHAGSCTWHPPMTDQPPRQGETPLGKLLSRDDFIAWLQLVFACGEDFDPQDAARFPAEFRAMALLMEHDDAQRRRVAEVEAERDDSQKAVSYLNQLEHLEWTRAEKAEAALARASDC